MPISKLFSINRVNKAQSGMLFLVYATALSLLLMGCEDNIIKTPEQIKAEQVKQEEIIKKSGITPGVSPMGKEGTILGPAQGPKHDHL